MRIELRTVERTGHAFLAHNRRRLHRQCDLHRVRHFVVRFRDRFEANLCRDKIDVGDFRLESEYGRRVAMRRIALRYLRRVISGLHP